MNQIPLFKNGAELKRLGLDSIEINHGDFIGTARQFATLLAQKNGRVTMDDVRDVLDKLGIEPKHANVYGAIFRGDEWQCIGWTRSKRPSNHYRAIQMWSLNGPEKLTCQPPAVKRDWRDREYYRPGRA